MHHAITERADLLYSLSWTAKKQVAGWKGKKIFQKGKLYHIPYGRLIHHGAYIGYGVSIEEFLSATNSEDSIFYQKRSGKGTDPENPEINKRGIFFNYAPYYPIKL